jgi:hypothetical protein
MTTGRINAESLLAIDVGGISTRAMLFDDVEGRYRFLGAGIASTTVNAPYKDVLEGIRHAVERLQRITGRVLVDDDGVLIIPSRSDGAGIDVVSATFSAGPPLKVLVLGLLEDISQESARNLAKTTYTRVVESIGLNDKRRTDARIDAILRLRPDLILAAGGTEGGATQSVLKMLEAVGLASYLMPDNQRAEVLYVGNQAIKEEVQATIGRLSPLHFAPNVRPELETEQLEPAQVSLAEISCRIRARQIRGVDEMAGWAGGGILPTATAFGRIVRFLSKMYSSEKGVLGVDVGATATTVAIASGGQLQQSVFPEYGLGRGLAELLDHCPVADITRWLHLDVPDSYITEYLYTKVIYPASLPATLDDLAIEQAIARQVIRLAVNDMLGAVRSRNNGPKSGLLPWFEPIVSSGSVLTRAPNHAQSLLILLDGLQPTGITTLVLDQNHLSSALGAAASVNPVLTAQVLGSSTFQNLGTVICPVGDARPGTPILRVRITPDGGGETTMEVKAGALEMLRLPNGQRAQLQLQPLHKYDVGMGGAGRGGSLRVVGGALGVIIDARGRPLPLPSDPGRRREVIGKWRWTLGC